MNTPYGKSPPVMLFQWGKVKSPRLYIRYRESGTKNQGSGIGENPAPSFSGARRGGFAASKGNPYDRCAIENAEGGE
ncbi:MAG: hypothetical protein LBF93_03890 [Zoogloeaceae bacterium]|jgi:hypothetical protein|nr:hypothetical protein [Zoogloeaceae bacterium]